MPSLDLIASTGQDVEVEGKPEAGPIARAARAAALQTIREGTPDEVREAFADLEALGDLKPDIDWDESDEESNDDSEEQLDAEMDASDEDDPFLDGWDDDPSDEPDAPLHAAPTQDEPGEELEVGAKWQLTVSDGKCRLERPHWIHWWPTSKDGKVALDDVERRMQMMERIALWLTKKRSAFLHSPEPWLLGCDAWSELKKEGRAPVVPEQFLDLAGISDLAGGSLFSRYRRAILLVWTDATMPLDFLFGREARMAWVANAVRQAALELGQKVDEIIESNKDVTKPKKGSARRALARTRLEHLDWPDLIGRINALADTKWADVLAAYRTRMTAD